MDAFFINLSESDFDDLLSDKSLLDDLERFSAILALKKAVLHININYIFKYVVFIMERRYGGEWSCWEAKEDFGTNIKPITIKNYSSSKDIYVCRSSTKTNVLNE